MKSYEDLTHKEAREHVLGGGCFRFERPAAEDDGERVFSARAVSGEKGLYVLVLRDGDGTLLDHSTATSLTALAHLMEEQGPLVEWFAEEQGGS